MTSGPLEIQDAYWAEFSVACDGLEAIRKAMADDTNFSCQAIGTKCNTKWESEKIARCKFCHMAALCV
eukprot:11978582-Ditylum_brightwellii.AAC.1